MPRRTPAGVTLVEVAILLAVIALVAAIGIPSLLGGRKAANDAEAIDPLRSIYTAERLFRDHDADRDGRNHHADRLTALAGLLPADLTASDSPERRGDRFFLLGPEEGGGGTFRASTRGRAGPSDTVVGI